MLFIWSTLEVFFLPLRNGQYRIMTLFTVHLWINLFEPSGPICSYSVSSEWFRAAQSHYVNQCWLMINIDGCTKPISVFFLDFVGVWYHDEYETVFSIWVIYVRNKCHIGFSPCLCHGLKIIHRKVIHSFLHLPTKQHSRFIHNFVNWRSTFTTISKKFGASLHVRVQQCPITLLYNHSNLKIRYGWSLSEQCMLVAYHLSCSDMCRHSDD